MNYFLINLYYFKFLHLDLWLNSYLLDILLGFSSRTVGIFGSLSFVSLLYSLWSSEGPLLPILEGEVLTRSPPLSPHVSSESTQSSFLDYLLDRVIELVTIIGVVTKGLMVLEVSFLIGLCSFLQRLRRDDSCLPEFPTEALPEDGFPVMN